MLKGTVSPHIHVCARFGAALYVFRLPTGYGTTSTKLTQLDATTGQDRTGQRGDLEIA